MLKKCYKLLLFLLLSLQILLQEGGPLPWPESGLLSHTQKWIVRGDTRADKARDFMGKGRPGGEQQGQGPQGNCSATWLAVSGFMVMGIVSGLSLASHLAWPIVWASVLPGGAASHLSAKMDSSVKDSARLVTSSFFGPSQIPPGVQRQHHGPYRGLLLRDSSDKLLSSCLSKAGGFGQDSLTILLLFYICIFIIITFIILNIPLR